MPLTLAKHCLACSGSEPSHMAALTDWKGAAWPVAHDWRQVVDGFLASSSGAALATRLGARLAQGVTVYPADPLRMLMLTPLSEVKVVILGQDPYHGPGQAEGLAFSVPAGVRVPPSLRNIHKELLRDLGAPLPDHGSLVHWARQGVLLLNTCLTVEDGQPASHARWGWDVLTASILDAVNARAGACVFMLWGNHAQGLRSRIDESRHLVLASNHPSPLSALRPPKPFLGCGHFSQANAWLRAQSIKEVDWVYKKEKSMA